jgi:hypothetical protein
MPHDRPKDITLPQQQVEYGGMMIEASILLQHIKREKNKYALWAFVNQYGGSDYYKGYLQALEDIEAEIKRVENSEHASRQLTLF